MPPVPAFSNRGSPAAQGGLFCKPVPVTGHASSSQAQAELPAPLDAQLRESVIWWIREEENKARVFLASGAVTSTEPPTNPEEREGVMRRMLFWQETLGVQPSAVPPPPPVPWGLSGRRKGSLSANGAHQREMRQNYPVRIKSSISLCNCHSEQNQHTESFHLQMKAGPMKGVWKAAFSRKPGKRRMERRRPGTCSVCSPNCSLPCIPDALPSPPAFSPAHTRTGDPPSTFRLAPA